MAVTYKNLESASVESLGKAAPKYDSSNASLTTSIQFVYVLLFSCIVVAAFYRYLIAGVKRMQASESAIRSSNDIFKQTTLGLLGIFSLFLLLSLVNKDMLTGDVGLGALKLDGITAPSGSTSGGTTGGSTSGTQTTQTGGSGPWWDAINADPAVRAQLSSAGISVNRAVCPNPETTTCTTVGGWDSATVPMLLALKSACPGGSIQVTGGTEAGHSSHGPGKAPVDIGLAGAQSCIRAFPQYSGVPRRGSGSELCNRINGQVQAFTFNGFVFCDEAGSAPHWHAYKP